MTAQARAPAGEAWLRIEPADTWFFRDGRSFDQGDPAQMAIPGQFPPLPRTTVGMVRVALARGAGWTGASDWKGNATIEAVVGKDDDLAGLGFDGPRLMRDDNAGIEPLFPAPAHLFGVPPDQAGKRKNWSKLVLAAPGSPRRCDLGPAVALPALPDDDPDREPLLGQWLTSGGLGGVLGGGYVPPTDIVAPRALWRAERHVGIALQAGQKNVALGHFFATRQARPEAKVFLAARVRGLKTKAAFRSPVPFGGESRLAFVRQDESVRHGLPTMPALAAENGTIRYVAILLTPALLGNPGQPGLPGTVVARCCDRPLPGGGWDRGRPRAQGALVPAGSVWVMEAAENERNAIAKLHGAAIGDDKNWGHGQVAIGNWPEWTKPEAQKQEE